MSRGDQWGPGSPDQSLSDASDAESGEVKGEEGEGPSPAEDSAQAAQAESESAYERSTEGADRTCYDAMVFGEYAFLPVFGFNESNIAARKYAREHGFEEDDSIINPRDDEPLMIGGKDLTWWEDNSIMPKHPFMLVNPLGFASVDPDVYNFREVFRVEKGDQFVFSDSGGYQLVTMENAEIVDDPTDHSFKDYRVYPERLLEWQVKNADAGSTIDYPPYVSTSDSSFFDKLGAFDDEIVTAQGEMPWFEFFEHRAELAADMTYRKAVRLKEMRDDDDPDALDYIYAPVIQGRPHPGETHKLVRQWHLKMVRACDEAGLAQPRGWVCSPKPPRDYGQVALFLAYAAEYLQDADFLHILMVGGLTQKALVMYYAKHVDQMVTTDASSYAAGGKRRQMDLPKTATRRSVIISSREDDADNAAQNPNKLTRYPCRCAVCSTVEQDLGFEFISNGAGSARSVTLNLHNLQQSLNIERTLDALLREEGATIVETGGEPTGCEFWRYLSTMARDKAIDDLYRAMDYVRIALEDGLEAANSTYRVRWERTNGKSIDRGGGSASDAGW